MEIILGKKYVIKKNGSTIGVRCIGRYVDGSYKSWGFVSDSQISFAETIILSSSKIETLLESGFYNFVQDISNYTNKDMFFMDDDLIYNFIVIGSSSPIDPPKGINCFKCNSYNKWAEPNQINGTHVCYICRGEVFKSKY